MPTNDEDLSNLIRHNATYHRVDAPLRARVHATLRHAAAPHGPQALWWPTATGWGQTLGLSGWRAVLAGFVMGAAAMLAITPAIESLHGPAHTEEELVADHVRSLRVGPLFAVQSTDRHTVKPWFQGKLDFAPPVIDLADQGFSLLGGRVENVHARQVATLVYGKHGHTISLFVWPSTASMPPRLSEVRGFNVLGWSDARMQFWMVCDMDAAEIQSFEHGIQAHRETP